jgi:hypothetical protein
VNAYHLALLLTVLACMAGVVAFWKGGTRL